MSYATQERNDSLIERDHGHINILFSKTQSSPDLVLEVFIYCCPCLSKSFSGSFLRALFRQKLFYIELGSTSSIIGLLFRHSLF